MKTIAALLLALITMLCLCACNQNDNAAHTHNFGHYEAIKEASCSEPGIVRYSCECGESYEERIETVDHSFSSATCTLPETCSVCGQQQGSALGHTYMDGICSICGQGETKPHELTEGYWYTYDEYQQLVAVIEFGAANHCYVYHYGDAVPPGSPSDGRDAIVFDNETLYAVLAMHTFDELIYTVDGNRITIKVLIYDYNAEKFNTHYVIWEAIDQDHYKIISSDIEANEPGFFSYQVGQTITWSSTFIPK